MKKWIGLCLLLTGCMVGPHYSPPINCVPETWEDACCNTECVPIAWWEQFRDPFLNRYIEAAACYNNDILKAETGIYQSRALRQIAASSLYPQLNVDLNASRTYFSKNGPVFAIGAGTPSSTTGLPFQLQVPQIQNIFTLLLNTSWQIDLFGKVRREVEAAVAHIGSAIEQRNAVLIAVIAEVSRNYIELRSVQQKGVLIEQNIRLLEDEAAILEEQWKKGLIDRLALDNIEVELMAMEATLPPICAEIYRYIYALSVLVGALPETLAEELLPLYPLPCAPPDIFCGLRSDVLRRRPDVRQAERELAAATANIGVAVASFYPTLTLVGDIGFQSLKLSNLFQADSRTWSIGGSVSAPIYQGGNLVGNLRLNEGKATEAWFSYRQTVLNALQEAESALIVYSKELETYCYLNKTVEKYAAIERLTTERYEKGLVRRTDVMESGRRLNTAQQNALNSETALLLDIVTLYKALGGGNCAIVY